MPITNCADCRSLISDFWTHCHDCRIIRAAQKKALAMAAMPRPELPKGRDPRDVFNYWGPR